jgi:hypothetical protein
LNGSESLEDDDERHGTVLFERVFPSALIS